MPTFFPAAGWTNLPPEILLSVAERLPASDVARLRSVSGNWASALGKTSGHRPRPPPPPAGKPFFQPTPWLHLPYTDIEIADECTFSSFTEYCNYTISSLPQITGRRLIGSARRGWLVTVDLLLTPRFFNPFTRQEIPLPSLLTVPSRFSPFYSPEDGSLSGFRYNDQEADPYSVEEFRDLFLRKIVLTSLQNGVAIAICAADIYKSRLAYARVCDDAWIAGPDLPLGFDYFEDVIYREEDGKIYAVSNRGAVFCLEYRNGLLEVGSMVAMRMKEEQIDEIKRYLVFSSDDLMQVTRKLHYRNFTVGNEAYFAFDSVDFKVFRFDPDCRYRHEQHLEDDVQAIETDPRVCPNASCWIPVTNIGDRFLLLGSNNCFFMYCDDEEKKNKVVFIDDVSPWRKNSIAEIGMFDLETNAIDDLGTSYGLPTWPPPFWFLPDVLPWD